MNCKNAEEMEYVEDYNFSCHWDQEWSMVALFILTHIQFMTFCLCDQKWSTVVYGKYFVLTHHKQTMSTVKLIFKEKLNRRCRLAWKMCRYFHLHASFGFVTVYTKDVLSSEFKLSRLSHVFINEKQNKVGLWQLRLLSCMLALSILSLTWHKMAAHIVVFSWLNFFFFFLN